MIVLYNPWSTPSQKKPLPMSLLAVASALEGEHEYEIVDGNLYTDPAGHIIALCQSRTRMVKNSEPRTSALQASRR